MKITITGPARRFESELDDQEGETLFRKIVGMIAEAATGGKPQLRPGGKARSMGTPAAPPALRRQLRPRSRSGHRTARGAS